MAWYKSSNYKVNSNAALALGEGFVGDLFVQSGAYVDVDGGREFVLDVQYLNAHNKTAVTAAKDNHYYEGMGSILTIKEKLFSNGLVYKMPVWSDKPLCSTNFPTGILISGYVYTPLRMQVCNGGINTVLEVLARIV